jgi:hypothetical protein
MRRMGLIRCLCAYRISLTFYSLLPLFVVLQCNGTKRNVCEREEARENKYITRISLMIGRNATHGHLYSESIPNSTYADPGLKFSI